MLEKFEASATSDRMAVETVQSITPANLFEAFQRAQKARERAISYRDFKVGATALALKSNGRQTEWFDGANIKPEPQALTSVHAEQAALKKATNADFTAVSMIAVVGETQHDQQSGREMVTLHPCGLCRDTFLESPLIDGQATLIASALPNLHTIELYSLESLVNFHTRHDSQGIWRVDLPSPDQYSWSDTVGAYLSHRRAQLLSAFDA